MRSAASRRSVSATAKNATTEMRAWTRQTTESAWADAQTLCDGGKRHTREGSCKGSTCSAARPHQLPGDDGDGDQAEHDEQQEDGEPVKPQQVSAIEVLRFSPTCACRAHKTKA